jgi:hypothetical protein
VSSDHIETKRPRQNRGLDIASHAKSHQRE